MFFVELISPITIFLYFLITYEVGFKFINDFACNHFRWNGTTVGSSRSSGTIGGQESRKARAKAQTILMEKEVCPSWDRKVCFFFHCWVA